MRQGGGIISLMSGRELEKIRIIRDGIWIFLLGWYKYGLWILG